MSDATATAAPAAEDAARKIIAVIDGNSLMHRAYHGVPPTMNELPTGGPPTPSSAS